MSATPPILPIVAGYFDKAGNPCIRIGLGGVYSQAPVEFEVIIDTGFTGFLSMPLIKAFPLGLPLHGTTTVTLADGASSFKLLANAIATLNNQSRNGLVILEPSASDVLMGMDFLRRFKLMLLVSNLGVALVDEAYLNTVIANAQAGAAAASGISALNGQIPPTP